MRKSLNSVLISSEIDINSLIIIPHIDYVNLELNNHFEKLYIN